MSSQERPQKNSEFMSELWFDGKMKAKSEPSKPPPDNEDMMLNPTPLAWKKTEPRLFTLELVPEINEGILTDKLPPSATCTQRQKSLAKSAVDSTSKEKNLQPYWKESCKEMSQELLSHTKTDWQDSGSTSINGLLSNLTVKSWFSTRKTYLQKQKWLKTSLPSSTASVADSMDLESIKLRSRKIKIYPSSQLKKEWNKWVAACRYCFNQAIAYQKENGLVAKQKLRNIIMQSDLPSWVGETPCHIRQNAIFDAHLAFRASNNCKFRSCKSARQTIKFNHSNYSKGKWYSRLTKGKDFQSSEAIPTRSAYATQIIKTKCGDWFAVFLEEVKPTRNNVDGIIAIDPGVRTFLTGFDGQSFLEIGKGDIGKITRLCQHLDLLMSKIGFSSSKRQRAKMRKAAARLRKRIRNLVDECHHQAANWLSSNYQIVLLPTFSTSEMTKKKKRKIRSKTARQMLSWSHYRFKQVLKNKAELSGCQVIDVTEEFTSKTCTYCGHVHQKLGGNKVFKCPNCGHKIERDFNGALGIMLKALRDTSVTFLSDAIVVQCDNMSFCTA